MPKMTVKDTQKAIRAMMDKHKQPPVVNPIDQMIDMAKKMNKGMMG